MNFTFTKDERLCSKKSIDRLFKEGISRTCFPVKVLFLPENEGMSRVLFSVPKRNFKEAVRRNTLRRRMREGYRLQKSILAGHCFHIAFIYLAKEVLPSQQIHEQLKIALEKMRDYDTEK